AVVQAALDSVEVAAEAKSIRIETVLAPDLTPILADPGRLQQIIWNLMSNAIKFTPMHGRVTVAVEQSDSAVRITVSDSGQGISRDFLPFVFDRFRQADSTSTRLHGGLGLGLAIVRHLVELHGGSVKVDSPGEGKGATFTVTLPLRVSVQNRRLPEPRPDPEPPASLPGLEGLRGPGGRNARCRGRLPDARGQAGGSRRARPRHRSAGPARRRSEPPVDDLDDAQGRGPGRRT